MDEELEEIALLEKTIEKELKPSNGHLRNKPGILYNRPFLPSSFGVDSRDTHSCIMEDPEILPQNPVKQNLTKTFSRSASDLQFDSSSSKKFSSSGARNSAKSPINRKVSSSLGDLSRILNSGDERRAPKVFFSQQHSYKKQGSIFDIAYPAVPPCRQNNINPGQKVAQV